MAVSITGRHLEITNTLRDQIHGKLPRIEKLTDKIQSMEVVLERKDRFRHRAEIRLKSGPLNVNANAEDPELTKAIELVFDKVERQLQKKMEKLRGNKKHNGAVPRRSRAALEEMEPEFVGEDGKVITAAKPETRRRAGARTPLRTTVRTQPVLVDNVGVYVFLKERQDTRTMELDEAAEELFFTDENFLVFENATTQQLNVIYRRKDGNFGMFEIPRTGE